MSLRIPSALSEELRGIAKSKNYLDVSELVRAVVRRRWLASKDPVRFEIHKLREELKEEIRRGKSEK